VRQPEDAGRSIQAAKNETALDHYQVRKHAAWHRHITLAPCAQAWLAVAAAAARPPPVPAPGGVPGDGGRARVGTPACGQRSRPGSLVVVQRGKCAPDRLLPGEISSSRARKEPRYARARCRLRRSWAF